MTALTDTGRITTRTLKGRARRAVTLSTKITAEELKLISAASEAEGRALGEWVREVLLNAVRSPLVAFGAEQIMTEIVSLQLFLTDVLSTVACGERITAEQYDALMRKVKASKHGAAREVIALYITENREKHRG